MKLTSDKKKEMLIDSFNVLKDNTYANCVKLQELITLCFGIDTNLSIELWEHLLVNNINLIKDPEHRYAPTYSLTTKLLSEGCDILGHALMSQLVYDNNNIKTIVFNKSAHVSYGACDMLVFLLGTNENDKVNHLLELIFTNEYKEVHFSVFLEEMIDKISNNNIQISEDAASLLSHWVDGITERESRARLNISLLKLTVRS